MTARTARDLWRVQLTLECKAFNHAGRLVAVACANPDPLHTGYAVRYCDGSTELAFAAAAPDWFVQQVGRHSVDEMIKQPAALVEQLQRAGHVIVTSHFHTYCFGDDVAVVGQPAITHDDAEAYSIVIDGHCASRASSSRSNAAAAELWIETESAHRRHGYAARVAQAWAAGVRQEGKIAFYSHLHDNAASAALAKHLGVSPLFEIIAINVVE